MLRGRLGLETARIPHSDRHGLLWLSRVLSPCATGLSVSNVMSGPGEDSALDKGEYGIPFQMLSMILLGQGSTVSHDTLRLMERHGTALAAVGEDGVRCYTAPPLTPDTSDIARRQMQAWGDSEGIRIKIARRMYALRLGEVLPDENLDTLRGIEGARMKRTYQLLARRYGVPWQRRRYDRANPLAADVPNQAINHASDAVTSAAVIAVTAVGAIPQLGFIHEHSGDAFALDVADLFRDTILLPAAFKSAKAVIDNPSLNIERNTRRSTGEMLRTDHVIPKMIDRIKVLFDDIATSETGSAAGGRSTEDSGFDR